MRLPWRRLAVAAVVVLAAAACGKKGPPLVPLRRVPAQVAEFSAARAGDATYLTALVPAANVGGDAPADLASLEVHAATAEREPALGGEEPGPPWTLVHRVPVRRPVPPAPPQPDGAPAIPPLPLEPGVDQGQRVTLRETLSDALVAPDETSSAPSEQSEPGDSASALDVERPALSLPPVAPANDRTARRFYVARGLTSRGRPGAWSAVRAVPLATPLSAPVLAAPTYNADVITLAWTPPPGAIVASPAPADGVLASRPVGRAEVTTKYNVYAVGAEAAPDPLGVVTRAAPLNAAPIDAAAVTARGVTFGQERCYVVRAVESMAGTLVEGPASAPACITPVDTFAPAAPTALEAVGGAGVISLIWEAVEASDLAGYLVFRGEATGEPTTPLTAAPIGDSSFEDRTVTPGVRYVYVVVAVDSATPANRSTPSNRAEETARQ